jgi:hypothetical protein
MDSLRSNHRLDAAAAVAMIVASLALAWRAFAVDGSDRQPRTVELRPYANGDLVDAFPEIEVSGFLNSGAVILWVHTACRYCEESLPFYRQIVNHADRQARVVVAGLESEEVLRDYLVRNELSADLVISAADRAVTLYSTPTLLILTPERRVDLVRIGVIRDEGQQRSILAASSAAPGN